LTQRKRARQRNKPPVNKHSENPTPKLVDHRADLWNPRTSHTLLREELTKQLPLKDRRKTGKTPNYLVRLRQSLCLNTNTRTGY
jgi:hypothetical protein